MRKARTPLWIVRPGSPALPVATGVSLLPFGDGTEGVFQARPFSLLGWG